ncbi:glutamate receptor ionotropic, kainate 3 [Drosophila eugracilis]|uniref:glutamate receptor ionotropic, kainate 3 n=1 Tax=Drosophila eugracilis TaxID=29029 RepID=UPI0007E89B50|nr:glutamate receptor ionotropic, kainate 3 [Drosophila eugracilis]
MELLLVFLLTFTLVNAETLKITFWIEPVQRTEFDADMAVVLKELDALRLDVKIADTSLTLTRSEDGLDMQRFCEILSSTGTSAVIDLTYSHWEEGYSLVRSLGIGYVRLERIMRPFLDMFGDFMRQKRANNVAMVFMNARDASEAMQQMLIGYPFRTLILDASQTDPGQNFLERIRLLRPAPTYLAIFARAAAMNGIFEKVQKAGLFQRPLEWHFVFLDTRDRVFKYRRQAELCTRFTLSPRAICRSMPMPDLYCGSGFTMQRAMLLNVLRSLINAAQVTPVYPNPIYQDCNATALSSEVTEPIVEDDYNWLDMVHWSNFLTYASPALRFDDQNQSPVPGLTFAVNISAGYYSSEHEAKTDLAAWSSVAEMRLLNETISPARRFFRIGTAESIPWSYLRRDQRTGELMRDRSGTPIWEGYCIDFIIRLSQKLNFEYEIVAPEVGHMGEVNDRGEWDGVVGDLVRGETDFAIAALKMYSEREEVIDFLPPYYEQTGISIAIRKPVRRTSLFKFMTVLRLEVWLSIVAALVGTAIMIWFMDKYSPYSSRNNRQAYPYACREFTLRESFWFALTSFTPQGGGEAPKAISGRMLVAAYWLFVVLMLATFTANLAAFLTVERMQTPVQSLEQLARQSRINYTVVKDSDTHQYFVNMKFAEDTLYRMWKELALNASKDFKKFRIWDYPIKEQYGHILLAINSSQPVADAQEGFANVDAHENADYAFIHDSAEIKYEITRNCNLTEVGEVFAEQPYAVAVQQGSHLGDELSYAILELQKDRFFEELKAKYWNQSNLRNCPLSEDQEGITLESLGGVFIATLFGLVLAMMTLGMEVLYYKKKQNKLEITQVRPMEESSSSGGDSSTAPPTATSITKQAWHIPVPETDEKPVKVSPPPSFEAATFRGKKLPARITLGDGKFKPRQGLYSRKNLGASDSQGGYME